VIDSFQKNKGPSSGNKMRFRGHGLPAETRQCLVQAGNMVHAEADCGYYWLSFAHLASNGHMEHSHMTLSADLWRPGSLPAASAGS
jgi:hypothetical protein